MQPTLKGRAIFVAILACLASAHFLPNKGSAQTRQAGGVGQPKPFARPIGTGDGAANAPASVNDRYVSPATAVQLEPRREPPASNRSLPASNRSARGGEAPIPLEPPDDPESLATPPKSPTGALWTVISSLSIVLGLFFVVVFISRRSTPGGPVALPSEAFEILGRTPLAGRQQAQVVRFGDKLILLAVSATSVESLAEVTTPEEVERIAGLCQARRDDSVSQSFQQVLHQFARDNVPGNFIGSRREDSSTSDEESVSEFEKLA